MILLIVNSFFVSRMVLKKKPMTHNKTSKNIKNILWQKFHLSDFHVTIQVGGGGVALDLAGLGSLVPCVSSEY